MNWSKVLTSGVFGGVALALYNAVMHGFIMSSTYAKYPETFAPNANPLWFVLIAVLLGLAAAVFFAKSRSSWSAGAKGGVNFGMWLGIISFLAAFYAPLTQKGFPYYLTWCMGAINFIGWIVYGAVAGALNKGETA